ALATAVAGLTKEPDDTLTTALVLEQLDKRDPAPGVEEARRTIGKQLEWLAIPLSWVADADEYVSRFRHGVQLAHDRIVVHDMYTRCQLRSLPSASLRSCNSHSSSVMPYTFLSVDTTTSTRPARHGDETMQPPMSSRHAISPESF